MLRFDLKRENPGLYKQGLISVNFLQHKATLRTVLPDWVANPPQSIPSSLPFSLPDFHQVCLTFHHYLFMLLQVEGKLKGKVSLGARSIHFEKCHFLVVLSKRSVSKNRICLPLKFL